MNPSGFSDLLNTEVITSELALDGNDPSSVPYIDAFNTLQDYILNDGQFVVGSSGNNPVAATLTGSTNITIVNGPGSITIDSTQPISPTSDPTFDNVTLTSLTPTSLVATDSLNAMESVTITNNNGTNVTFTGSTLAADNTQNLSVTGSPSFEGLNLTAIGPGLDSALLINPAGTIGTITLPDGYLMIGVSSSAPVANLLTGSSSISITPGPGTITIDTTQSIAPAATPTFTDLILSSLTPTRLLASDGSKQLQSVSITNNNGTDFSFGGSTLACSLRQDLQTSASPAFVTTKLTGVTGNAPIVSLSDGTLSGAPLASGQLLIGTSSGVPNQSTLTPGSNIQITNGSGSITIDTSLTPTFTSVTLATTGGTPTALAYYEEYTHTTTFSGPISTTSSKDCLFTRVGRVVTIFIPGVIGTGISASSTLHMDTAVPNRFCPGIEVYFQGVYVQDNGIQTLGYFLVRSLGSDQKFYFGINFNGPFSSNAGNTGAPVATTFTYTMF